MTPAAEPPSAAGGQPLPVAHEAVRRRQLRGRARDRGLGSTVSVEPAGRAEAGGAACGRAGTPAPMLRMRRDLGPVVIAVLVVLGTLFLVTGVGGGRYDLATGEWSFGERSSPAGTRVVGALMIGFALLLWISRPKP